MQLADLFAATLLRWFDAHGRHDLPWQKPRSPYRVWLSEIMLQQTQVATVIPYFLRFVEKFASISELAAAPLDDVLAAWSGLGYYSRARNLHRAAKICAEKFGGELPCEFDALSELPGIGRSTAGAILAQAFGARFPILDGNVKRVLARFHGVEGWPGATSTQRELWSLAESHTPHERVVDYTQAIMDFGATVCTRARPRCEVCPMASECIALKENRVAQLPQRKPAREVPTRTTTMLIVRDALGKFLLRRRPSTGVWAELWSLPEAADIDAATRDVAAIKSGDDEFVFEHLPTFTHAFTHYRLDVTPLATQIERRHRVADERDVRWVSPDEAAQLGLPSPVRKLIENYARQSE